MVGCARLIVAGAAILSAAAAARADAIWTGQATAAPLIKDVRITRVDNERVYFEVGGRESSREREKVVRIALDNEPALTAAEDALALDRMDDAIVSYTKVVRSSSAARPWLSDWASRRLQTAAERSGRFDAAVTAYVARLQFDAPGSIKRPDLPDSQSTYLNSAVTDINAALSNAKLTDDQRTALLSFLIDVHRARRDAKSADATAGQLDELLAKDPSNPNAGRAIARRKLQAAQSAFDKRDWRQAFAEIDANRAMFSEPQQQADALYLLAESRYQIAIGAAAASAAKVQALKEAALAFVRVMAHCKDQPDRPHVTQSLLRVGQIHEQIGDPQTALRVYEQLASQYPDDPVCVEARQLAARLPQSPPSSAPASASP